MGMAAILVMWPGPFIQTFVPPSQGGSTYNLALIGQAVSEEKMFKHCWRRRQRQRPQRQRRRQRTPEQGYTISSPCEPNGSGELKMWQMKKNTYMHFEEESIIYIWSNFQLDTCSIHACLIAIFCWQNLVSDVGPGFRALVPGFIPSRANDLIFLVVLKNNCYNVM